MLRSDRNCQKKSKAELFAEINVITPAEDNESDKENLLEGETKAGEREEQLQAVKPPKQKRKTKKKTDLNNENHPPVKDKFLVSFYNIFVIHKSGSL